MNAGLRFLVAARRCEIDALEQLAHTGELVGAIGRLVHALQKERGISNLFLASGGTRCGPERLRQIEACAALEQAVRAGFERLDTEARRVGDSARLFSRIAYVLPGLDALPGLRRRIAALALTPAQATAAFVKLIAGLLAVVFEAADGATDPEISRLLVEVLNFMQGKEFAGQERALGAAAFAGGRHDEPRQQQWLHLIESQERCFQVFGEFASAPLQALWRDCQPPALRAELERLRRIAFAGPAGSALDTGLGQVWFDGCTQRIDAMKAVEDRAAADLIALCEGKTAQARAELAGYRELFDSAAPAAFFDEAEPLAPASYGRQLERSVLDMVQEQSRRLQAMNDELATVRAALNERKLVERAKGLLMAHHRLSEDQAHKMLRQTAMNQNRRLVDVAESVLAMAEYLPRPASN